MPRPSHDGTTVDYALLDADGKLSLHVEAKAVGPPPAAEAGSAFDDAMRHQ